MLLKITNQCQMGCSHCLDDAKPVGEFMTRETFNNVMKFIKKVEPSILLLSGGEPTEHPLFKEFLAELIEEKFSVLVVSNGSFFENEALTKFILDSGVPVQITNDDRYYPTKPKPYTGLSLEDEVAKHSNFILVERLTYLLPMGRAATMDCNTTQFGPKCFNFMQIVATDYIAGFTNAVRFQESRGKVCNPAILFNGDIVFGESTLCRPYGNVNTEDIVATIININVTVQRALMEYSLLGKSPCDHCGAFGRLYETLDDEQKHYIIKNLHGNIYNKLSDEEKDRFVQSLIGSNS